MNFRFLILLPCVLAVFKINAQIVHFYNVNSLEPVSEVFIVDQNHKRTAISNNKGEADLSEFLSSDTLLIQHPSYFRQVISHKEIAEAFNTVYLTESAVDLGEFRVLANKRQQMESELPMMVLPITRKEIRFKNPQTSADLLAQSGEVFVQKSQMGGGSPMIRGFSANRILIVVDDIRMNNAIFRGGNLQNIISIDPNNIETSEVIFGPGSVIYGSDALGGVMNFHSIDPKYSFKKDSVLWQSDVMLRYASANNERTAHVMIGAGGEKLAAMASFTMSYYDDLVSGSRQWSRFPEFGKRTWYQQRVSGMDSIKQNQDPYKQVESGYNQLNAMTKVKYQVSKKIDLELAAHYSTTSNIPRYDRLIQEKNGAPKYAEWAYGPQDWFLGSITSSFDVANDAWDRSRIIVGYQHFNESRIDRKYRKNTRRTREEKVNAYNINVEFDKELSKNHNLFYGLEGVYNEVSSHAESYDIVNETSSPSATRYPDGGSYWANAAAYLTYQWDINPKLSFNTGLRYTYINMESKFVDTSFYQFPFSSISLQTQAFNGSFVGLTYRPVEKWQLKLNTSSGFRAPNIDDIAKVFDSEPGKVVVPNEHLKSEFAYNSDLSFARKFSDKGKAELTLFYTYMTDAMVRRKGSIDGKDSIMYDGVLSEVQMITNTGKAQIYGASVAVKANLSRNLGLIQTFTWTGGEDLIDHVPLRHVSPAFGKTSFYFKNDDFKTEFYLHYNAWIHWDELAPEEQGKPHLYTADGTPAWATLNLRASYAFTKHFSLNVSAENLLDQQYRPYSSGISAAGRNFIVALRATI